MAIVTDPDNLDRFQVAIDPIGEIVSLRGLGTERHAVDTTGDSDGTTTFTDAGANFTGDGVVAGDILTIISDPGDNGGIIGHYRVVGSVTGTTFVVDRAIPASTSADLTYKINAPQTTGVVAEQLADGVTLQALYSFLKEEWRVLAGGLGNSEDLIQFDFPFVPITRESMIMGGINGDAASDWTFADDNGTQASDTEGLPRELIRTGGWQERDSSNDVLREYAGVITLGALDTDAQGYFQQGDTTGTPSDFKLTGAVNQAVLTFGPDVGPDAGTAPGFDFDTTTITRNDGGNWTTDNYRIGDFIQIRSAEDSGNDGNFGPITAVDDAIDGTITIASASFTTNTDDTTAIIQVDHRQYLKLRVRKKARSYAEADLTSIGVTTLEPIVNRFPLAHVTDPAITLEDGILGGDNTTIGDVFQEVESHTTGSDGATESDPTADPSEFTFTSAGSTFNSTARGSVQILQPGDTLHITSGSDQGRYVIKSIDGATQLTCFKEPTLSYTGGEGTLNFTVYARTLDVGAANATLTDVDGSTGTLVSAGSTFDADNGLGDRIVSAGDMVEVTADTAGVIGVYKVVSRDSATQLTLNTSDQIFGGETNQTYRVLRPGMHLQRFESSASISGASNIDFGDDNPDTITRTGGNWVTDGFTAGMALTVVDAEDGANIQTVIIDGTPTATIVTLIAEEAVFANATDTTASQNGNITGDSGITRTINNVTFPFHWRLFANGGTLSDIFQFLQFKLRLTTDIDEGNGSERGDITDLLMTFASPTGTTLDLFPDDLSSAELNNVTYQDISSDDRNNAFLVGITFQVNNNLINSATARLVAFFNDPDGTPATGDEFGTNGAVIVDDESTTDMDFSSISGDIQTTFDYTNNAQGGRTPDTDAPITVVALGDDLAQHILVSTTITKVNSLTIAVLPPLERNYNNP